MSRRSLEQVKQTIQPFTARARKLRDEADRAGASGDTPAQRRALRKLAQSFLQTFQPALARKTLEELENLDGARQDGPWLSRANRLCALLEGQVPPPEQGSRIPIQPATDLRFLVRTGQLETARKRLECHHPGPGRPSAYLQPDLLGAYLAACQGQPDLAEQLASEALDRGIGDGCGWTIALGYCRLGHAKAIAGQGDKARECYQESLSFALLLELPRLAAEPLMGLAFLAVSEEDGEGALSFGQQSAECLAETGDVWALAQTRLVVAVAKLLQGDRAYADSELQACRQAFTEARDSHLECATLLWMAQVQPAKSDGLRREVEVGRHPYLLDRNTLYAPRKSDETLSLKLLGRFRAFRGGRELEPPLPRRKSVELLCLLVSRAGQWIDREELLDLLWPDHPPQAARRDLSVALHHLASLLAPKRARRAQVQSLERAGNAYRFAPDWRIRVDAMQFESLLNRADRCLDSSLRTSLWQEALALYQGPYLNDVVAPWSLPERERLLGRALRTMERLACHSLEAGNEDQAQAIAAEMLRWDPAWEQAYRVQIQAHLKAGRTPQAVSVFRRCELVLKQEYDIKPARETTELIARALEIRANQPPLS